MRLRNIPWAQDMLDDYPQYVPVNLEQLKGHWQDEFHNNQPIYLEVGSGKGRFIYSMAQAHPDINFIAMELQTSVAVRILERIVAEPLPNLRIINQDGGEISVFFASGEISRIYLNFSDPWPKKRHTKRRLTSPHFLNQYEQVLSTDGELHFKTDNQGLFEYSLASMSQYGMAFKQVWLDLRESDFQGNIMTEYEEKFSAKGHPIYRLEAIFPQKKHTPIN
ncbi:tRNA (guanosine(46)-N7)-methyltransferase TrmB [Ignavigranum ruoffiae]|uniref:tRNA (guanosine(46)-N7)-methyltransferase TrmB n=1 Tax=Ignavigranum ruoffiae TaxID=89093 RepID=UPI002046B748|nr:tRNA (guanosine(46)-N7)-methyltransferase TrmB [Ignavigranum ruoffiae]UPQ85876.1 tRNA (guanosine(46)-N7)-methyltransferase TrmB [Ignavigranum ruoffiae]